MKRRLRRIVSWLCVLSLCLSLLPGTAWATGSGTDGGASDGAPTLEKTATDLENDQTTVELSIGSTEEKENVAVLFVLDYSTSVNVRNAAEAMLEELAEKENTNIKVCVINYWAMADTGEWKTVEAGNTENLLDTTQTGGTNLHGGLLAAQKALEDPEIDDYETYLITISDGITYLWTDDDAGSDTYEKTMSVWYQNRANGPDDIQNGNSVYDMKYGQGNEIAESVFTSLVTGDKSTQTKYSSTSLYFEAYYGSTKPDPDTESERFISYNGTEEEYEYNKQNYLIGTEIAIYKSAAVYKDLVDLVDYA